jgi:hypothetical protein
VLLASQLGKSREPYVIALKMKQQFIKLREQFPRKVTWHIFKDKSSRTK